MVGSEISFSLLVIFFLAAVVLMCIVYLLRKMMDRREYLEKIVKQVINFEDIDSKLIGLLVEKIIINLDGSIEINFKFKNQSK